MPVVTPEARAAQAVCAPIADKLQAQLDAWLLVHRLPGEGVGSARRRFAALCSDEGRERIRAHARRKKDLAAALARKAPPVEFVALVDDGIPDDVWAKANPNRAFRVRPWRPCDGSPATYHWPCISAIHLPSKRGVWGIPIDALHNVGFPAQPEDSDRYGELIWLVRSASGAFRRQYPGASV